VKTYKYTNSANTTVHIIEEDEKSYSSCLASILPEGTEIIPSDPVVTSDPERIAALWQAAHEYEYASISGSAIGLVTIGIMTGKPKCLAVQVWVTSIWSLYYTRKAGTSTDTDYTSVGPCPYSVPELMVELGL
jgi:hypothetical protein